MKYKNISELINPESKVIYLKKDKSENLPCYIKFEDECFYFCNPENDGVLWVPQEIVPSLISALKEYKDWYKELKLKRNNSNEYQKWKKEQIDHLGEGGM
jgi:hypothetical protein